MKEKLQQHIGVWREGAQRLKGRFRALWSDPENALLFRATLGLAVFVMCVFAGTGYFFFRALQPTGIHGDQSLHADLEIEAELEDNPNDTGPVIGIRSIPKSISRRQDGIPETDKDLVEPDLSTGRGLAALREDKVEAAPPPYNPFMTYSEILGSTSEQSTNVGRVAIDISFEVDSHTGLRELADREKEVKFMISSLIAEHTFDELRVEEGRAKLKQRIYQEVNYILKSGKVQDVLYSSFIMK